MSVHGKRDPEGERRRIEKAQQNGFGQPGVAGRPKKDSTDIIEERAAAKMAELADRAISVIERGMKSGNEKTALAASAQFFKTFHHPTQKVDVSASIERTEQHIHMLQSQNQLSEADQNLLGEFLGVLRDAAEAEVIEAEVVEEVQDQLPPANE